MKKDSENKEYYKECLPPVNKKNLTDAKRKRRAYFRGCPDVITVTETAELMGVCKNTVYKLLREKKIPSRKVGAVIRIRKKDLLAFIKNES